MKQNYFLSLIFLIQSLSTFAQVGINKEYPTATLDVSGTVLVQEKLYLENPGRYVGQGNSKLLMINEQGTIIQYNIANGSYGPLNYVQFVFRNTSDHGLDRGYNTRISATKYKLAVHGYSFNKVINGRLNTNFTLRKTSGYPRDNQSRYIEGHQFYAYIGGPSYNRTWFIKGFVNNSQFYVGNSPMSVDIYMDVLIYRNDFITKFGTSVGVIDMKKKTTATAPLPPGF